MIIRIYSTQEEMQEYWDSPGVSQSLLKAGLEDFRNYYTPVEIPETDAMLVGNIVDMYMTHENPAFEFANNYEVVYMENSLSATEKLIVEETLEICKNEEFDIDSTSFNRLRDFIVMSPTFQEWQKNWKLETRVNKIIEKGSEYFDIIKTGKKLVPSELFIRAEEIKEHINKEFERTVTILRQRLAIDIWNVDVDEIETFALFQLPLKGDIKIGNETLSNSKGLLDCLLLFYYNNMLYWTVIDFKAITDGDLVSNFQYSFKRFRYDIQAAFYEVLVQNNWNYLWTKVLNREEGILSVNSFTPCFVVANNTSAGTFATSLTVLHNAYFGRPQSVKNDKYYSEIKGLKQAIEEYYYYSQTADDRHKLLNASLEESKFIEIFDFNDFR